MRLQPEHRLRAFEERIRRLREDAKMFCSRGRDRANRAIDQLESLWKQRRERRAAWEDARRRRAVALKHIPLNPENLTDVADLLEVAAQFVEGQDSWKFRAAADLCRARCEVLR